MVLRWQKWASLSIMMIVLLVTLCGASAKINGVGNSDDEESSVKTAVDDNNFGMKMNAKTAASPQPVRQSRLIWDLDSLHPLLRAGIILNMRIAEERKAKGLDMPPRYYAMAEKRRLRRLRKQQRRKRMKNKNKISV